MTTGEQRQLAWDDDAIDWSRDPASDRIVERVTASGEVAVAFVSFLTEHGPGRVGPIALAPRRIDGQAPGANRVARLRAADFPLRRAVGDEQRALFATLAALIKTLTDARRFAGRRA